MSIMISAKKSVRFSNLVDVFSGKKLYETKISDQKFGKFLIAAKICTQETLAHYYRTPQRRSMYKYEYFYLHIHVTTDSSKIEGRDRNKPSLRNPHCAGFSDSRNLIRIM